MRVRAIGMGSSKHIRAALFACLTTLGLLAVAPTSALSATARLAVDTTDSADPVTVGQELAYTVTVTNSGPDAATGVKIVDKLAARLDFVSVVPSEGSCGRPTERRVVCTLRTFESGGTATIVVRVRPTRAGRVVNTATVRSRVYDPGPANNIDTERTLVVEPVIVNCADRRATIVGTEGDDRLTGTEGPDVIAALGGDDEIEALGGEDIICGSGGNDMIRGKSGRDMIQGGGGNDLLRGGGGSDVLRGKSGDDALKGGRGGDVLRGGGGADICSGGSGSDKKRRC